jgi:hypothetical protein
MDLGTHGGVCSLATEGQRPVDLGMKVADRSVPHRIYNAQHTDLVTQVDGPVMMEVLLCSVSAASGAWSMIGGGILWWWQNPVSISGPKP